MESPTEDRRLAVSRVQIEVRGGRLPHPNTVPCTDCGHRWAEGDKRHEYDHYLGYEPEHHLDVEPVCTPCHRSRTARRRQARSDWRGPRTRTQALLSAGVAEDLRRSAASTGGSPSALIVAALEAHLPLPAAPAAPAGELVPVQFRIPFDLHGVTRLERQRWNCPMGALVEAALAASVARRGDELQDFRAGR